MGGAYHQIFLMSVRVASDGAPELIPQSLAGECLYKCTGLAGIYVGMTGTLCLTVFSWTTHNDIGISVPVDIAHTRRVASKRLIRGYRMKLVKDMAIPTGVNASESVAGGTACDNVGDAIAVSIARRLDTRAKLIARGAVCGPQ